MTAQDWSPNDLAVLRQEILAVAEHAAEVADEFPHSEPKSFASLEFLPPFKGTYEISKPVITIGRDEGNDCEIANEFVSRRHVTLSRMEDGNFVIENQTYGRSSRGPNTVRINGKAMLTRTQLNSHDDLIELGLRRPAAFIFRQR